jgi:saccharopine dehydrogenase (NAD+, L-lysine-forming)
LVSIIKESQVLVNASWYEYNFQVMKAALEVRTHYLDLGGLYYMTKKQLDLHEDFKKAKITAILGIGASPGITNVLAGYGATQLDQVDEIHIRTGSKGGGGFAYSAKTILDEVTMNPILFENGVFREVEPLSGKETYRLPQPIDEVQGFHSIHSELATLPFTVQGVRAVTFRVAFSPSLLKKLETVFDLGLFDTKPISVKGISVSPRDFLYTLVSTLTPPPSLEEWKGLQVEVIGKKKGQKKCLIFETVVKSHERWKLRATAVWTGIPAAIAAHMLGSGEVKLKGVFAPETALDSESFIAALGQREIKITMRET